MIQAEKMAHVLTHFMVSAARLIINAMNKTKQKQINRRKHIEQAKLDFTLVFSIIH